MVNIKKLPTRGGWGRGKWGNHWNFLLEVKITISTLVYLQLCDSAFLICNYSIFNQLYTFDKFPNTYVIIHRNDFSTLSIQHTEMKQSNSERKTHLQKRNKFAFLNLYIYSIKNSLHMNKYIYIYHLGKIQTKIQTFNFFFLILDQKFQNSKMGS